MTRTRSITFALAAVAVLAATALPAQAAPPFQITVSGPSDFYPGQPIPAFSGVLSVAGVVGVPGQSVELQLDGVPQAGGTTDPSGAFAISLSPIADTADHVVTAVAFKGTPLETSASAPLPVRRFPLTVTLIGNGTGTVTGPGISCPGTCSANLAATTNVPLTPNPSAGSLFAGWSGDCAGMGPCVVSMTQARTVGARFDTVARIAVSPQVWNIPDTGFNQDAQMTFTVTNIGGSPSGPVNVSITNQDGSFSFVYNFCGGPLLPSQYCSARVNFHQNSLFGFPNGANLAVFASPGGGWNIPMQGG